MDVAKKYGITPETIIAIQRDPKVVIRGVLACEPDPWQEHVCKAIADPNVLRIAVKSCHGPGKSFLASSFTYWWLMANPDGVVIITGVSFPQLRDVLRRELAIRYESSEILQSLFELQDMRILSRVSPKTSFASIRSAKVEKNEDGSSTAVSIQGMHGKVLVIIDEASGVDDAIFEAVEGFLSGGDCKLVAFGNPTTPSGAFYRAFNRDADLWTTFTVSYLDSPRVSNEWAKGLIKKYGRDSAFVRARVLGEFPFAATDAVYSLSDLETAYNTTPDPDATKRVIGIDVARFGKDKSVLAFTRGAEVLRFEKFYSLDATQLVIEIERAVESFRAEAVVVDADGIGGPVADMLRKSKTLKEERCHVIPWQGSKSPRNKKSYHNSRTELNFRLRDAMREGRVKVPRDDDLEGQAAALKYKFTSSEKIMLERKEDLARRIKMSPDELDAVCYGLVPYLYGKGEGRVEASKRDVSSLFKRGKGLLSVRHVLW